ncbi:hypothetical protein PMAYCL1PPCAC_18847, partial [Pristionchus mayeri]
EPPPYCGSDIIIVTESLETGETINLKMAAPFDSDDMMKRSLFSAIFGLKKNSSSSSRSRASSVDQPDQPGPSWASAPTPHHSVVPSTHQTAVPTATSHPSVAHPQSIPSETDFYHPSYPPFPSSHPPPPLPVLTAQCPFIGRTSYSSLAHQSHAPPAAYPPQTAAPYAPYAPAYAAPPPPPYSPYAHPPPPPSHASDADFHRTKADIYREIVYECEEFERSSTTTPLVESSPATPTVHSPLGNQWNAQMPQQQQPIHEITANFSMLDLPPGSTSFHCLDQQKVANLVQQQIDVKPILGDKDAMEALVRLVVQAVKDTGVASNPSNTQSPEEILRRKRQMNNEAAARYRKRQREEKEKQHVELDTLEQRNLDLKKTVDDMEREIAVLKKYVLEQSRHTILTKVEEEQA